MDMPFAAPEGLAHWTEVAGATGEFTKREAVLDSLEDLDIPIVFDVEIGNVPPQLSLVNGALTL
ncbi:hypothetical protein [Ornithinimicrobium faecis]|uniref:hypothetical protein n=1 Tax=Ornithinimicrobium faecis TaxID=2934158 RepID=UPI00211784E7|nr:hypothetical protein [Ornithinimicrobium sp. HY1745]